MLNRRGVLAAGGIAAGVFGVPKLLAPAEGHENTTHAAHEPVAFQESKTFSGTRPEIVPWTRPMPVPPVLKPLISTSKQEVYQLSIERTTAEILPGLRSPVMGFGGQFVGPTIKAKTGRKTLIMFQNKMDEAANVHLHGGHVPPEHDGHPKDLIEPGRTRLYLYPNTQQGTTLWYHDHSHGTEAAHVYLGLHGAYVIEDDSERPALGRARGQRRHTRARDQPPGGRTAVRRGLEPQAGRQQIGHAHVPGRVRAVVHDSDLVGERLSGMHLRRGRRRHHRRQVRSRGSRRGGLGGRTRASEPGE